MFKLILQFKNLCIESDQFELIIDSLNKFHIP